MTSQIITLEGRNTVHDALTSGRVIRSILISTTTLKDPKIKTIASLAGKHDVRLEKVRPDQIDHISESGNAQGVIAYLELPEPPSLDEILKTKTHPFLLLFNSLDYEQNLGALMRSAWAAGVDAVIVPNTGVHEITPVVAKVSQGAAAFVFGGEAASLSEPLKKYCDLFVHIPMVKKAASLNVSVATALIIFEKTRQERN